MINFLQFRLIFSVIVQALLVHLSVSIAKRQRGSDLPLETPIKNNIQARETLALRLHFQQQRVV